MKRGIMILGMLLGYFSYGQQLKKVELTKEEIHFISENRAGGVFSEPDEVATKKVVDLNNTVYIFEIYHQGNLLFRESLRRWSPYGYLHNQSSRTSMPVCFRYSDLPAELILNYLENKEWNVEKTGSSKFICNRDFKFFKENYGREVEINQLEGLDIKLFKLVD